MKIEKLIKDAITGSFAEYQLRQKLFLETLQRDVSILVENSETWFGSQDVPNDYKKVVNSLMNFSFSTLETEKEFYKKFNEDLPEKFSLIEEFREIQRQFDRIFSYQNISIEFEEDLPYLVCVSRIMFSSALQTVFLSFAQFMNEKSSCQIKMLKNRSNVIAEIDFLNLLDSVPDISKLMKNIFSYETGDGYHVGIGLLFAVDNLKKVGAQVNVNPLDVQGKNIQVLLMLPSLEFLELINDIRAKEEQVESTYLGDVMLEFTDFSLQIVLQELLADNGYKIINEKFDHNLKKDNENLKAVILDYRTLLNYSKSVQNIGSIIKKFPKMILIHEKTQNVSRIKMPNIKTIVLPFDINSIVELIEE